LCITEKHELWVFGCGRRGVLGLNSQLSSISPTMVNIKNVLQVAAGEMHSICVINNQLVEDRNVFGWGDNTYNQVSETKALCIEKPTFIKHFKNIYVTKISAGKNHSCALSSQQKLYLWGDNSNMQLLSKSPGIVCVTSADIIQIDDPIKDMELYDNITVLLLESGLVLKSNPNLVQRLHVPCNCSVVSICISSICIYALSVLNVVYSVSLSRMSKNIHYKMTQVFENAKSIFTGYYACAIDSLYNLWVFTPTPKLNKEASGFKTACVTQHYTIALLGIEKNCYERQRKLMDLQDIAQEKIMDIVVRLI
jgi:Regulator of chromosome condensation (RCC1) repeat